MWGGEDPRDCRICGGDGRLWVSNKDRLALYPGGPFRGQEPGAYEMAARVTIDERGER